MKRLTQFKLGATSTKHVPTPCDMPQQGGQIDATYCAQQYCMMLRLFDRGL